MIQGLSNNPTDSLPVRKVHLIKRMYFTLLEVMIVLMILGIGAALTGFKIKDLYADQRYMNEIQQIASHLQTAQDMMLIMQSDIKFKFFQTSRKTIAYQLIVEKPLPPNRAKISEKIYELKSVRRIDFNNQSTRNEEGILLTFFSRGMVMSKGKMLFFENEDGRGIADSNSGDIYIGLLGYPQFIESGRYRSSRKEIDPLESLPKQGLYPKAVLEELNAKAT